MRKEGKRMKRILSFLLIFLLLCPATMGFAAGAPAITVSQSSAGPGEETSVTVSLSENPGIVGMTLGFEYDSSRLELLSIQESGLGGIWQKATGVAWANDTGDSTYNGVFLTLTFKVRDTAESGLAEVSVKYSPGDICNYDLEDVNFTVVSGGVEVQDCSLSGTLFSWNSSNDAVVALYGAGADDDSVSQDIRTGAGAALCTAEPTAAAGGQGFVFRDLKPGSFKLAIYKPGGYAVKIKAVSVDEATDLGVIKLWLYGDVVYDGVIQESDAQQLQRYIVGEDSVFGTGSPEDEADRLKAANVSIFSDGEERIESGDALQIRRYIAGLPSAFNAIQ